MISMHILTAYKMIILQKNTNDTINDVINKVMRYSMQAGAKVYDSYLFHSNKATTKKLGCDR